MGFSHGEHEESWLIPVRETAKLLGVSPGTVYKMAREGELPSVRLGRRVLIHRQRLYEQLGVRSPSEEGVRASG